MSNRRVRGRASTSYSVRLQRRVVVRRRWWRPASPRASRLVAWLPVGLAVAAELGHLGAAYVEWPESAARGSYHVVAGALLGLVATAAARPEPDRSGWWAGTAVAVAAAGPALWLGGGLLGAPPYAALPVPAAAGIAASEVILAVLLFGTWQAARARR